MKVHHIKSATVIVESNGVKILCDPWFIDGEYYGSWHHYPPYKYDSGQFDDVDYIYISHIHPDHFSKKSLQKLDKNIPVLIHKYGSPFLKKNIKIQGFKVIELNHNEKTHLKNNININIFAADDCNPELCMKFFGCGLYESKDGSTQVDSLCVIDDGTNSVLNLNDCPWDLAQAPLAKIKSSYKSIDFLLVGYTGAGPFPQCFSNFNIEEKKAAGEKKKQQFLNQGLNFINLLNPKYFMPFAGTYQLGGSLHHLNDLRGVPELEEAVDFLNKEVKNSKGILLDSNEYFDLELEQVSLPYQSINLGAKQAYIKNVLAKRTFDFENNKKPSLNELIELVHPAHKRMNKSRKSINFSSSTIVIIPLVDNFSAKVSMCGNGVEIIKNESVQKLEAYVQLKVDTRLLTLILKGPRFAHWNNAEIGSHIEYFRKPEKFERGLYYAMNFFHS
jgi:UDP-MurNAc hydroxylase